MNKTMNPDSQAAAQRWWQVPQMWLVLGLPALVVVGGFAMLWVALARPDAVVDADYYAKGLALGQRPEGAGKAQVPAQMGRNHAMTPDRQLPPPRDCPACLGVDAHQHPDGGLAAH